MVFSIIREPGRLIASVQNNDMPVQYECSLSVCPNPVCTCGELALKLIPMENQRGILAPHTLTIIPGSKKLKKEDKQKDNIDEMLFAEMFMSQLDEDDYLLLESYLYNYKKEITENASVDSINAHFDYDEVERDGLMSIYNDVLPYAETLSVSINDKQYELIDQYCLLPGCSCTDTTLSIFEPWNDGPHSDFPIILNYKNKQWKEPEGPFHAFSTEILRLKVESQIPDFYEKLYNRHKRLKAIYAHCKRRHNQSRQRSVGVRVGRNDPCPCGSGKKYKKCCLDKDASK